MSALIRARNRDIHSGEPQWETEWLEESLGWSGVIQDPMTSGAATGYDEWVDNRIVSRALSVCDEGRRSFPAHSFPAFTTGTSSPHARRTSRK